MRGHRNNAQQGLPWTPKTKPQPPHRLRAACARARTPARGRTPPKGSSIGAMGFGDGLGRDAELQAAYADRATVKARRMASIYRTRRPGYEDTRKWRSTKLPDAVLAVSKKMAASRYASPTPLTVIKPDVLPTMRRSIVKFLSGRYCTVLLTSSRLFVWLGGGLRAAPFHPLARLSFVIQIVPSILCHCGAGASS